MSKSDPIRKNYYDAIERVDKISDWLFYLSAVFSCVSLFAKQSETPNIYTAVQTSFALSVVALFAIGLISRLYLIPRAEDKRRQDFFASACGISLNHQKTEGYYNNDFAPSRKRMAAQLLENSHFSKAITLCMARTERVKVGIYLVCWFLVLAVVLQFRELDLSWVVIASQTVFSEQIFSKWLKLEWLRMRVESTYDDLYRLFRANPTDQEFDAMTMDSLGKYEAAKSTAGITFPSAIFERMNGALSTEWEQIKADLGI